MLPPQQKIGSFDGGLSVEDTPLARGRRALAGRIYLPLVLIQLVQYDVCTARSAPCLAPHSPVPPDTVATTTLPLNQPPPESPLQVVVPAYLVLAQPAGRNRTGELAE